MKTKNYFQKRISQAALLLIPIACIVADAQFASAQQPPAGGAPAAPAQPATPPINWIPGAIIGAIVGGVFVFMQNKKKKDQAGGGDGGSGTGP